MAAKTDWITGDDVTASAMNTLGGEVNSRAPDIHASSAKTTPVDADEFGVSDSAASFVQKKSTWANIKAALKTYLDGTGIAKLTTARTIQTNLAASTSASFDGTANVTPGVTGNLPVANGGTGASTAAAARTNLGATTVGAQVFTAADAAAARAAIGAGTGGGALAEVDGTAVTTSSALQTLIDTGAATGQAVRLKPGQAIAVSATITIPSGGGIVCDGASVWKPDAPPSNGCAVLTAQSGLTGPIIKVGANSVACRGVRLRGLEIDANGISTVTHGISFNTSSTDVENSHRIQDVLVRRVTNGTGISGRLRTTALANVNVFQCLVGVKIGADGPWYDCHWYGGYIAYCRNAGVQMGLATGNAASGLNAFHEVRVERTGQIPNDPNNATSSGLWNSSAPGWDITAATMCMWTSCTTDANNGPAVKMSTTSGAALGYTLSKLVFTGCEFNRDGQSTGLAMDSTGCGVSVIGGSTTGADQPPSIRFQNCIVAPGESADDGSSTYQAPAIGLKVDHAIFFAWIGHAEGISSGISVGTNDLWKPIIIDQYANRFDGLPAAGYTPGGTDVAIADGGTGVSTLPTGLLKGAGTGPITAATPVTDYLTQSGIQILTATQVRPRVLSPTASATPAFNIDNADKVIFTVNAAITSLTSGRTGTPYSEQPLWFVFQPTATFAIAWGTGYEDSPAFALPLTTSGTTRLDVLLTYNATTSKFRCMGFS